MTGRLLELVERELAVVVPNEVQTIAGRLADELRGVAVLYYGSTLRTGDLDAILDFYVLTDRTVGTLPRRIGMRWLWPDVSYHEIRVGERTIRAKVATMPVATFARAARGSLTDTTIWTRFVQPAALVWATDDGVRRRVTAAVADAVITAATLAAVLGPIEGDARQYWLALFQETYRAELRVEPPGRENTILRHDPARYAELLPVAWHAAGLAYRDHGPVLTPLPDVRLCWRVAKAWMWRADAGKALNIARLVKATFTFTGAARYALWKIQRHTGMTIALTPWRERHPVLAAPAIMWQVMRQRAA